MIYYIYSSDDIIIIPRKINTNTNINANTHTNSNTNTKKINNYEKTFDPTYTETYTETSTQRKKCNKKYERSKKIHQSPKTPPPEITNLTKKLKKKINKTVSQSTTILDTIQEKSITLKLFYADWCGHCNDFKPIWFKLKSIHTDINFVEVDCTHHQPDYEWLNGYPTIAIFENDNFIQTYQNNRSYHALDQFINELN
jgi:hypothetical protein